MKKIWLLLALLVATLAASPQDAPPTIRTTTRLVQLDVVAVDKKGQPVRDLKREDFEVREEGKPQPIRVFAMVAGDAPQSETDAETTAPPPPGVFTNRIRPTAGKSAPSAITMVLFDALNTRFTDRSAARKQVLEVIDGLNPNERVALLGLGSQLLMLQDFTQDPALLRAALVNYGGPESKELRSTDPAQPESSSRNEEDFMRILAQGQKEIFIYERTEQTLLALEAIANHVAKLPGRKNLVWVSAAFPVSLGVNVGTLMTKPPVPGDPKSPPPEYTPAYPVQHLFTRSMRALSDANVAVYPVDARGIIPEAEGPLLEPKGKTRASVRVDQDASTATTEVFLAPTRIDPIETMKNVAEDTGGIPFYNTNDLRKAVRRAIDDSAVSYTIGFYPKLDTWDGRFRRIALKVKRPGVTLRHRRGYFAYSEPVNDEKFRQATMRDLALSPLEARAIRLTARLGEQVEVGKFRVALEVEPTDIVLRRDGDRWLGALDVLGLVRGADGKPLWADLGKVDLSLDDKGYETLLREGLRFTSTISLPAGAHEVRLVVRDWNSGAAGSVHIPATAFFSAGQKAETIAETKENQ